MAVGPIMLSDGHKLKNIRNCLCDGIVSW